MSAILYLTVLGSSPVRLAPSEHDSTVSLIADDTDLDDDVVGAPCVHPTGLDDSFQNFDLAVSPAIFFRRQATRLIVPALPHPGRVDDGGLFRPPRASLV